MGGTGSSTERAEDITSIRVMVADDEETVVDVLRSLIGSDPSLRFVGAASDAEDAIDASNSRVRTGWASPLAARRRSERRYSWSTRASRSHRSRSGRSAR